ncbi:HU family DNA-binding protein [Bariatricus massiliensis]|uniref:HU family DNA-binding protein n=1 Tax=Bariatricus massiliensis TaxID=1745713 RepID=A0ABS8DM59_9FIRM|nr:HU family DNA-binding protein [Bariatricus massiliensis]MCB7306361.1 HU family DNA-binding protein [Bariatricus massiliensis]MCB7376869.1 HU family DNA-binding protein [Bariatricus massiliensis]MCB7389540.1 HU family DNA-binding protein [Bariatricus massiliensis]MCB7413697.1 HU family DNA-binding protein [Bariatricus massiliensis]MCQ5255490.1 HU family DNA-binding protein [Bariatricus massiliensis]
MTKAELAAIVAQNTETSTNTTMNVTNEILKVISEKLAQGEKIQLVGFGTFDTKQVKAREGRNPHNGEILQIPAHKSPRFRPGKQLKEMVQQV